MRLLPSRHYHTHAPSESRPPISTIIHGGEKDSSNQPEKVISACNCTQISAIVFRESLSLLKCNRMVNQRNVLRCMRYTMIKSTNILLSPNSLTSQIYQIKIWKTLFFSCLAKAVLSSRWAFGTLLNGISKLELPTVIKWDQILGITEEIATSVVA